MSVLIKVNIIYVVSGVNVILLNQINVSLEKVYRLTVYITSTYLETFADTPFILVSGFLTLADINQD